MVRNYKQKRQTKLDTEHLLSLVKEYEDAKCPKIPLHQFAKSKGVCYTTFYRWVNKCNKKKEPGRPTVLTEEEESLLSTALKFLGDSNMGQDREDIRTMVQAYLTVIKRPNPFKDNKPGRDWIFAFEKRHPDISRRTPETLTAA